MQWYDYGKGDSFNWDNILTPNSSYLSLSSSSPVSYRMHTCTRNKFNARRSKLCDDLSKYCAHFCFKKDHIIINVPFHIIILFQARTFNESPINPRKCIHILTKILYLLNQVCEAAVFDDCF